MVLPEPDCDPPDLSFWSSLTFCTPVKNNRRDIFCETRRKKSKENLLKCANEVSCLFRGSIKSCTVNGRTNLFLLHGVSRPSRSI